MALILLPLFPIEVVWTLKDLFGLLVAAMATEESGITIFIIGDVTPQDPQQP